MKKTKKKASVESPQTTWKAETGLPYIRTHPLPPGKPPQWWQVQRDLSDGREDPIAVCAFECP